MGCELVCQSVRVILRWRVWYGEEYTRIRICYDALAGRSVLILGPRRTFILAGWMYFNGKRNVILQKLFIWYIKHVKEQRSTRRLINSFKILWCMNKPLVVHCSSVCLHCTCLHSQPLCPNQIHSKKTTTRFRKLSKRKVSGLRWQTLKYRSNNNKNT